LNIRISLLLAVAAGIVSVGAGQAMPHVAHIASSAITPVSSGCGLGVLRGPYDGCVPFYSLYPAYPYYYPTHYQIYYYRGPVRARANGPVQSRTK